MYFSELSHKKLRESSVTHDARVDIMILSVKPCVKRLDYLLFIYESSPAARESEIFSLLFIDGVHFEL